MLSGYKNELYEELEKYGWVRRDTGYKLSLLWCKGKGTRPLVEESVWMNYNPSSVRNHGQLSLDECSM